MSSLQDALFKNGIISVKTRREQEAEKFLQEDLKVAQARKASNERERRIGILKNSSHPQSFRQEARKLLLQNPMLVQEIINIAHSVGMKEKKNTGGTRLIANLYQVKEAITKGFPSEEDKKIFVDKLFPKK